ncbi:hypothetical protein CATMIT_02404, partial [Catenibacterium mitsuokai DSM 15897]
ARQVHHRQPVVGGVARGIGGIDLGRRQHQREIAARRHRDRGRRAEVAGGHRDLAELAQTPVFEPEERGRIAGRAFGNRAGAVAQDHLGIDGHAEGLRGGATAATAPTAARAV